MALNNILKVAGVTAATVAVIAITAKVIIAYDNKKEAKWDARLAKALADIDLGETLGNSDRDIKALGLRFRAKMARLLENETAMKEVEKEIAEFVAQK